MQILRQKWTNDQSVPISVVHYMISIQDCLGQTKELASENEQKSKVKYKSCYDKKEDFQGGRTCARSDSVLDTNDGK